VNDKWWVQLVAIVLCTLLLFGPMVAAIIFDMPGLMFISLFVLILLLAG
jgi:hypothetical protein